MARGINSNIIEIMNSEQAITAFAALSNAIRLAALRELVSAGPAGVASGELATRLRIPASSMSVNLQILARAGLAAVQRAGKSTLYRVEPNGIQNLVRYLLADCCGGRPELCGDWLAASAAENLDLSNNAAETDPK